ncbi:ornithine decarboxylase [Mesorhizobium sp.]|uniref:ornithine decarboxylase n=1 Tax=Mesorhizobium sp. TaxID=1871066 RepID=UPI000FEA78AE|nr:ornithine decarboxylase [Mesorhizobium sp.]RWO40889.1 MAG: ornithine decarboxylase [Mesorhizobium sp.]TIN23246.1 MAG: ornithine decarboxylase [Mesorhizobium sp.]TIN33640.1 MAG: ornithine decarboxylase [Mesorhizobium sp.]TJU77019.1 MAG: ornithine decarboxylase [Mesorhizobium sp.]TJU84205.1 MAG: ornithine decarboxylase [Mesorhizobium sp.]
MIPRDVRSPTAAIPFHKLLKIVAIVDDSNPLTKNLLEQIAADGFEIEIADSPNRDVSEDASVGAYIASIDGDRLEGARSLARAVRAIGFRTPLWALADAHQLADMAVLIQTGEVDGYIYLGQQTPAFYAKQVVASLLMYGKTLLPPFFGGLMAYDGEANIAFDCPGHQGGQFYQKSPAGQLFFKHFGENIFRNDLCNADVDLGDLLIHEGPAVEAQRYAARVFGADKTYFVLNGTSTSNKIVANAALKHDDLVLFDRNNHKSLHQGALVQAGAIPIFLPTARNSFGMIGAVDWNAWDEDYLREQIRTNPLVKDPDRHRAERPFRLACIQLATYDGTVYNVRKVMEKIGHLCDYILWDEAWIGYNAFHPLFEDHSPMRLEDLGPQMAGLFSTQSVHKQGAGFSQASQIHKRDQHISGQRRFIEHKRFNESFLMNVSTSPFYPLFASLEVNAKVHEGKAGEMLWDRCIALGIDCRKKLREFCRFYEDNGEGDEEKWFFDPFVPDKVTIRGSAITPDVEAAPWESLPTDVLKREPQCWNFHPEATWHGYSGYVDGYAMVDPNKLALVTPGIDRRTGDYLNFGVPATVVANYLREQRVVPEKCDLNSILFLMTPAEDESKLNTLIAKLVKFKNLWDRDAPLPEVLPTVCAANSQRYAGYTIRKICNEMHDFYRAANVKGLQLQCFRASSFPELAMPSKKAYEALVANDVDYIPLANIKDRISATLALIYPPGIGVVVPGERWDERARPMLDYFLAFEESFNRFPGFNYEVQGVFQEKIDGRIKFHTYVVRQ